LYKTDRFSVLSAQQLAPQGRDHARAHICGEGSGSSPVQWCQAVAFGVPTEDRSSQAQAWSCLDEAKRCELAPQRARNWFIRERDVVDTFTRLVRKR
jgi:hypothetical protein